MTIAETTRQEIAIILTDYSYHLLKTHGNYFLQTKELLQKSVQTTNNYDIKLYDAQTDQFPALNELGKSIKAIWITGSSHDAFADYDWIINLTNYIKQVLEGEQTCPVVGICFGHQIIGRAIGAEVCVNTSGWELGIETVRINDQDEEILELFKDVITKENTFNIFQVHRDIVKTIPQDFGYKIIGSTDRTEIQGIYKKNVVLSFQGHPEFKHIVVRDSILNKGAKGIISKEMLDKSLETLDKMDHQGIVLTEKVISKFMGI